MSHSHIREQNCGYRKPRRHIGMGFCGDVTTNHIISWKIQLWTWFSTAWGPNLDCDGLNCLYFALLVYNSHHRISLIPLIFLTMRYASWMDSLCCAGSSHSYWTTIGSGKYVSMYVIEQSPSLLASSPGQFFANITEGENAHMQSIPGCIFHPPHHYICEKSAWRWGYISSSSLPSFAQPTFLVLSQARAALGGIE